jgi:choline dehydrogenase-like flavoprotein
MRSTGYSVRALAAIIPKSRTGRWDDSTKFIPFIGSTTGGSTGLYGMALERFFPCDFSPRQNYPDAPANGLPQRWPVSYEELVPYNQAAERLYRVRGGADELRHDLAPQYSLPAIGAVAPWSGTVRFPAGEKPASLPAAPGL